MRRKGVAVLGLGAGCTRCGGGGGGGKVGARRGGWKVRLVVEWFVGG